MSIMSPLKVSLLTSGNLQCDHIGVPTGRVIESLTPCSTLVLALGTEESFTHRKRVNCSHSVVSLDGEDPYVSAFAM
jgi:hypothetical protein